MRFSFKIEELVRIDAPSKEDWDARVRLKMLPALVPLGADPAALTAVRLTRLPNCMREETGKLQRLLYLDPEPDGMPICHKPATRILHDSPRENGHPS